ncbi:MAG: DUF4836 family protein [Muribaculaceae bacterium]|nr:DUF4836 family protein [Muribaculaceae bacterium]
MAIISKSGRGVRLALLCLLAALIPALNSCKQEPSDVSSLLATVPSSSGMVVGINLKSVLEKAGCEVDGSSIKAGKEVKEWLGKLPADAKNAETLRLFLNGDSGIDPLGAVFFSDAYNVYATAMLADTDKFISFVEKQSGSKFADEDGSVKVCGNVAVLGAQMWLCTSATYIDAKAVKNYATLSESQNFMSKDVSAPLAEMKTDVVGWADINTIMKNNLPFGQMAQVNLIMGALYDNPASLAFSLDFKKGNMEAQTVVLNDKGDKAKFLLPTKKIDTGLVKGLGGNADLVVAACVTKDLVKKVEKMLSSLGGGMFSNEIKALGSLDGTVAVAQGIPQDGKEGTNGVAVTDGNPSLDLMNILSRFGQTRKDGNNVFFSEGTMAGPLNVETIAGEMDGAWLGVAFGADKVGSRQPQGIKDVVLIFRPDGNGLTLNVKVNAKDDSKNILLQIVKDLAE